MPRNRRNHVPKNYPPCPTCPPPAKQEILDGAQVNDAQDELERYGKTPAKEYSWRQALLQAYLLV